jgi:3-oxoadipyl-CoA thiolase
MKEAFVLDILRTPIGRYGGALSSVRPDDLVALVISKLLDRNPSVPIELVEDVILGAANQAGEDNRNVARMAALLAGLPIETAGVTINRLCASGLEAIIHAGNSVMVGNGALFIAGGVESMSRAPFVLAKSDQPFNRNVQMFDTTMGWRFTNAKLAEKHYPFSMGETAENVASKFGITRLRQDEFALESQVRYAVAEKNGKFSSERVGVSVPRDGNQGIVVTDEHPRETSLEKLSALKPAFKKDGTVTAGNSSGINDGAAACLIVDANTVKTYSQAPMVRIVASAVAGVEPAYMGLGPIPATQKVLKRAGLKLSDIGLVELNEAFASQVLACMTELDLNPEIVNVNGGAIAMGHPLGCSGVRISATLIHEMKRRKVRYGLATMCVGVGQGVAVIYELC